MSSVAVTPPKMSFGSPHSSLRSRVESSLGERLSSTLLLRERAAPLTVPTGIATLDALTGGLPRGALSEIAGPSFFRTHGSDAGDARRRHSPAGGVRAGGCQR